MIQHPFLIFNASAGSGKTFTLVKAYLSILLASNKPDYFKHILAVTFTNKAVGEMKHRILESLIAFSKNPTPDKHRAMFNLVCKETNLNNSEITLRAQKAVQFILHHYSFFDVETIDRFNHRLIRTFARDLKLASNFDVELEVDVVLNEAVDKVISQVGKDEQLTKVILDFSFEKADDDKSWDISSDLKKISQILRNENDLKHFELLKSKTIADFIQLKKTLLAKKQTTENHLKQLSVEFFDVLSKNNLDFSDFTRKSFPNYFQNIANGKYDIFKGSEWEQSFGSGSLYPQRVKEEVKNIIDGLEPGFVTLYEESAQLLLELGFLNLLLQNVNSISLINSIYTEYLHIQSEKNILPISEFNSRINNEIKNQPAPFIYERLGEKYHHFFIDEFQDTSQMQWNNLIPLIENALSQSGGDQLSGSLLLVGDAKQSIYRWRGGDPDQFINLYGHYNPFLSVKKNVETLGTNFRSYDEVVNFNNSYFNFVAKKFSSKLHLELYEKGNSQKTTSKQGGYVSIEFLDPKSEEDKNTVYQEKTLEIIDSLISQNYALSDICILVRTNNQGVALAEFLSKNNIKIISSEALLLESAPEIVFIINLLKTIQNFEDKKARAAVFYFLHNHLEVRQSLSDFLTECLSYSKIDFSKNLKMFGIEFSLEFSSGIPLFDLCENICASFSLSKKRVAYIQSFLELVFEFSSKESNTITSFLEFWEDKKTKSSVEISDKIDAVTIMTVHKSKGLEFPVVIYPYADDEIVTAHKEKIWLPIDENEFNGFSEMLVPAKKELENYGEVSRELYEEIKMKSELDTLNIVYVAMTRAVEQLYVLTDFNSITKENRTGSVFHHFLNETNLWDDTKTLYQFGKAEKLSDDLKEDDVINTITTEKFPENNPYTNVIKIATKKALLWNTEKEKAIDKGDLLHDILAEIFTVNDKDLVLQKFILAGVLSELQAKDLDIILTNLISHPNLSEYFKPNAESLNEKEIFTQTGESLRPDRINFIGNKQVAIIDYKTGLENTEHKNQIKKYGEVLKAMSFKVQQQLLVYIKEKVEVVVVNQAS